MRHAIHFGGDGPQDVTVTTSGPASGEGLARYVNDLVDDDRFRPGLRVLVDHRELDATTVTPANMRAHAELMKRLDGRLGDTTIAFVVGSPLAFGYARMYELHAAETQLRSHVFYSREEAIAWLSGRSADERPA